MSEMLAGQARKKGPEHCVVANWSRADDTLSGCALNESEDKLCCILVTQMQLGKVHHGAVLHAKVVTEAIKTGGVYFVAEDAAGDLVKVGVCNDARSSHATAARMFRTGQTVSIAEPHDKQGSEGQPFVHYPRRTPWQIGCAVQSVHHAARRVQARVSARVTAWPGGSGARGARGAAWGAQAQQGRPPARACCRPCGCTRAQPPCLRPAWAPRAWHAR